MRCKAGVCFAGRVDADASHCLNRASPRAAVPSHTAVGWCRLSFHTAVGSGIGCRPLGVRTAMACGHRCQSLPEWQRPSPTANMANHTGLEALDTRAS
jgi:hypothetical protein